MAIPVAAALPLVGAFLAAGWFSEAYRHPRLNEAVAVVFVLTVLVWANRFQPWVAPRVVDPCSPTSCDSRVELGGLFGCSRAEWRWAQIAREARGLCGVCPVPSPSDLIRYFPRRMPTWAVECLATRHDLVAQCRAKTGVFSWLCL